MNKKKQIIRMLQNAKSKQKEAEMLLEEAMKVVSVAMDVESLEDVEIEKLHGQAREIIKSYIKDNGKILGEAEQKNLFSLLLDVNYKKESMSHFLRDLNIKYNYLPAQNEETWSRLVIGVVDG